MAKQKRKQEPKVVRRDGGLCVTFANSASAKRKSFQAYAELLAWGLRLGAVTGADAERLERAAAERPEDAAAIVRRALELRDSCRRTLRGLIGRQGPSDADYETLRAELMAARSAERWVRDGIGFQWVVGDRGGDDLDRMLWPVATSIAEVLETKYRLKVGECAGEDCDLLFIDRSPGSARRWCDKEVCGSKINSRNYYQKRVKPRREAAKRAPPRSPEEVRRRLEEARERDLEQFRSRSAGRRPGPRVA